ncbi:MAG: SIS domain-containing protein [Candidatus Omnitrophota bacterium]|nr:SIS domain-containing protein [Candidatus Omnitrophota bacterium]
MKTNRDYIDQYLSEMKSIVDTLDRDKIDQIIDAVYGTWANGKRMYLMGNGGSGSTASHLVNDFGKCTALPGKKRFKVIGLTDNMALTTALVNDNGFDNLYSEQMLNFIEPGDTLVGFSAHGGSGKDKAGMWSQNLLKAYLIAKEHGVKTIGFSGYDGGVMKEICDICVTVPFHNTQHVESFHLALGHLVCNRLIEKIASTEGAESRITTCASA